MSHGLWCKYIIIDNSYQLLSTSFGPGTVLRVAHAVSPRQPLGYSSGIIPVLSDDGPERQGWCPTKVAQHGSSNKILARLLCFFFQTIQKPTNKKTHQLCIAKRIHLKGTAWWTHAHTCMTAAWRVTQRVGATHSPLCCAGRR